AEIPPADVRRLAGVDLQAEEAFGSEFRSLILVVHAQLAVEPDLEVVALREDADFVPIVPFEKLLPLFGEGLLCGLGLRGVVLAIALAVGDQPAAARFVVESG